MNGFKLVRKLIPLFFIVFMFKIVGAVDIFKYEFHHPNPGEWVVLDFSNITFVEPDLSNVRVECEDCKYYLIDYHKLVINSSAVIYITKEKDFKKKVPEDVENFYTIKRTIATINFETWEFSTGSKTDTIPPGTSGDGYVTCSQWSSGPITIYENTDYKVMIKGNGYNCETSTSYSIGIFWNTDPTTNLYTKLYVSSGYLYIYMYRPASVSTDVEGEVLFLPKVKFAKVVITGLGNWEDCSGRTIIQYKILNKYYTNYAVSKSSTCLSGGWYDNYNSLWLKTNAWEVEGDYSYLDNVEIYELEPKAYRTYNITPFNLTALRNLFFFKFISNVTKRIISGLKVSYVKSSAIEWKDILSKGTWEIYHNITVKLVDYQTNETIYTETLDLGKTYLRTYQISGYPTIVKVFDFSNLTYILANQTPTIIIKVPNENVSRKIEVYVKGINENVYVELLKESDPKGSIDIRPLDISGRTNFYGILPDIYKIVVYDKNANILYEREGILETGNITIDLTKPIEIPKSPSIIKSISWKYPDEYYVGEPAIVTGELTITNIGNAPLVNKITEAVEIPGGRNVVIREKDTGAVVFQADQFSGMAQITISYLEPGDSKVYEIEYEIPTADISQTYKYKIVQGGTLYDVYVAYIKVKSPIPINNLYYTMEDVDCKKISRVLVNDNQVTFTCSGDTLKVNLGYAIPLEEIKVSVYSMGAIEEKKPAPYPAFKPFEAIYNMIQRFIDFIRRILESYGIR